MISENRQYPLSLAATYLSHWTVEDAVREILQNALDQGNLDWELSKDNISGNSTLTISTPDVQLHPSVLLLGSGSKGCDEGSRGGFGEGLKVALLILAREGMPVVVRNGNKVWTPVFQEDAMFGSKMLHIHEEPNKEPNEGLVIEIGGLTNTEVSNILGRTLQMQDDLGEVITSERGAILLDPEYAGKIYVGGLFVCTSVLKYGYDLNPSEVTLNRDRQALADWDVNSMSAKMWMESGQDDRVVQLCLENVPDVAYVKYNTHYAPASLKSRALAIHKNLHGAVPLATSKSMLDSKVKEGYTDTIYLGVDSFTELVRSSPDYVEIPTEVVKTPTEILKGWAEYNEIPEDVMAEILEVSVRWKAI